MTVVRDSEGLFTISWNNNSWFYNADSPFIIVCGFGTILGASRGGYASVFSQTSTSATIQTADDASPNDMGFNFYIMNVDDWTYL